MFNMSPLIKELFKPLRNAGITSMDFDAYYYCAILGMAHLTKIDSRNEPEIIRNVPNKYSQDGKYKELLLTMINAEVKRTGNNINNRNDLKTICNLLLESFDANNLTSLGATTLNDYCMGGYHVLINNKINTIEPRIFFQEYLELLNT